MDGLKSLAADLRKRLQELDAAQADKFTIGDIALPLADHYWSLQQKNEAKAVVRTWAAAVQRLATATTMSMLASGWLRELHEVYKLYEMNDEARQLVAGIELASAGINAELVKVSASYEIPNKLIDHIITDLTSGTKDEMLRKIALNFLRDLSDTERLTKEIASETMYMQLKQELVDEHGRVVAIIPPIQADAAGHIVHQLSKMIQLQLPVFRLVMQGAVESVTLEASDVIDWLENSALFTEDRLKLLEPAVRAYFNADWSTMIHIVIPQIGFFVDFSGRLRRSSSVATLAA